MDTVSTQAQHVRHDHSGAGTTVLALGVVAALSAVLTGLLSFTDVLDPPEWARIVMTSGMPVGILGAPAVWFLAPGARRELTSRIGLALVALTVVAFVVMLNIGY